jgi:hypothetical protein
LPPAIYHSRLAADSLRLHGCEFPAFFHQSFLYKFPIQASP